MPSFKTCFHPTWRIELNYSLSRPPLEDINTHSFFFPSNFDFVFMPGDGSICHCAVLCCMQIISHCRNYSWWKHFNIGFFVFFFSPYSPLRRKYYAMEHKLITMKWLFRLYIVPLLCDLRHCFHNSCFSYPLPDWIN